MVLHPISAILDVKLIVTMFWVIMDNQPNSGFKLWSKLLFIVCSGARGGNFITVNGHMSSPSYPNYYPANEDCIYTVSESTGTVILLNFLSMDIHKYSWDSSCDYDYLEIRDGPSDDSPLLDKLCGSEIPAPIQSTQNQLWMK